jgi:hypothetical protein
MQAVYLYKHRKNSILTSTSNETRKKTAIVAELKSNARD